MTHRWAHKRHDTPAEQARRASYNTAEYRAAGKQAGHLVRSGQAHCWRCHRPIPTWATRGPHWVVGHDDHDRRIIRGVECTPCNRKAANIAGNLRRQALYPHLNWHRVTPLNL